MIVSGCQLVATYDVGESHESTDSNKMRCGPEETVCIYALASNPLDEIKALNVALVNQSSVRHYCQTVHEEEKEETRVCGEVVCGSQGIKGSLEIENECLSESHVLP